MQLHTEFLICYSDTSNLRRICDFFMLEIGKSLFERLGFIRYSVLIFHLPSR